MRLQQLKRIKKEKCIMISMSRHRKLKLFFKKEKRRKITFDKQLYMDKYAVYKKNIRLVTIFLCSTIIIVFYNTL